MVLLGFLFSALFFLYISKGTFLNMSHVGSKQKRFATATMNHVNTADASKWEQMIEYLDSCNLNLNRLHGRDSNAFNYFVGYSKMIRAIIYNQVNILGGSEKYSDQNIHELLQESRISLPKIKECINLDLDNLLETFTSFIFLSSGIND